MSLGEFELIDRVLKPLARGYPGALNLSDDAALVDVPAGCQLIVAKDAMVADVHFLATDPPELIAGKLLRVNLSDLAAHGGGRPLPRRTDHFVEDFQKALALQLTEPAGPFEVIRHRLPDHLALRPVQSLRGSLETLNGEIVQGEGHLGCHIDTILPYSPEFARPGVPATLCAP